jgi:ATP-dependent DNA helicase RecG
MISGQGDSASGTARLHDGLTMTYSDSELEALLADVESDRVERKESWSGDAPSAVREAVRAFANDLPDHQRPSVAFVGARNDGMPSGLAVTDQLLQTLGAIKSDGNTVPPPSLVVEKRVLRGAEMAVVTVAPSDAPPVRYKGRTWVRIGLRRGIATLQDERILSEKRRFRDRTFDARPIASATLADLSRTRFDEEYLPQAFSKDVLEANERSYAERLAAAKMIASPDEPMPTVAGILVIGTSPRDFLSGAYVQFLRIAGTELSEAITDEAEIDGTVADVIRRAEDKLDAHNQAAVDIARQGTEASGDLVSLEILDASRRVTDARRVEFETVSSS